MTWKKLLVLLSAGFLLLPTLFFLALGIWMVSTHAPSHHDFKEGLLALIPSIIMLVVIPLIAWALLTLDWFHSRQQGDFYCPKCGYNMAGLSATNCPECGAEFTIDQLRRA